MLQMRQLSGSLLATQVKQVLWQVDIPDIEQFEGGSIFYIKE